MNKPVQYALVLDETYHAVVLRDLFQAKAREHHDRAASAVMRKAVRTNLELYEMYSELAARCEHIRQEEVARITKGMDL